jgi:hypothetical protein
LRIEVRARLLEEAELVFGDSYVFELYITSARRPEIDTQIPLTINLRLEPPKSSTIEFLVWCAVGEAIGDGHIGEKLEYAALHSQFVEIGIQEGEYALGQVSGIASHGKLRESYASQKK